MSQPFDETDDDLDLLLDEGDEASDDDNDEADDYTLILPTALQSSAAPVELQHTVTSDEIGERLDKVVSALRPELSRSHVQRLIAEGDLQLNSKTSKPGYKLRNGDSLFLRVPPPAQLEHLVPENIPLNIVYEDEAIIVINKPAGMVVHPAYGHNSGTLVNALLYHVPNLSINGNERPGIVHRLDKDTSGLLVVAKTDVAMTSLIQQMKARTTTKEYLTLVEGNLQPPAGIIDAPIGRDPAARKQMAVVRHGKPARTRYEAQQYFEKHTYVQVQLETGRTHQIRVHFAYLGHSVVGDPVYGRRKSTLPLKRQFLHATRLGLALPTTGEYRYFDAPLPADLQKALDQATLET